MFGQIWTYFFRVINFCQVGDQDAKIQQYPLGRWIHLILLKIDDYNGIYEG